jgi:hypothetical protein
MRWFQLRGAETGFGNEFFEEEGGAARPIADAAKFVGANFSDGVGSAASCDSIAHGEVAVFPVPDVVGGWW